ncbi:MAG: DUF4974 domain-containing protein [Bacteroidaceae bacterium]|nr:DUF4974 domain-containing protein [Bacteroidaceae bacterium]
METVNDAFWVQLAQSTRSPRGKYSKESTWPLLERRLREQDSRLRWRWLGRAAASVAVILMFVVGWAMYGTFIKPIFDKSSAPVEGTPVQESQMHLRGAMTFQQVPLQQIVEELNQSFASDIRIADEELKDYHITATFSGDETLDTILDLLQRVANLQIVRQGPTILIKKGGAEDEG